ncbi:Rhodanese-like domain containing protein [Tritrichomonas foetus]|uniref:protein-tyrosine-phosphatase n=1 Tax=Tritrichomonas foetus TaxID=1144522 RepID=A0A1J4KZL8_9EUKA|nr:Rhodanese-like domain containing protein [Tritrichomonas foetus]|eukprot:OHT15150.1 Rhodanese-like domain containing protein [Tritrichomonas foetus]
MEFSGIKETKSTSDLELLGDIPFPNFDEMKENDKTPRKRFLSTSILTTSSKHVLPILPVYDIIPHITPETMVDVLNGKFKESFEKIVILDCRFKYEYDGGHIIDALNVESDETLKKIFFSDTLKSSSTCIIFHCEYSHNRGPQLAKIFREIDRQINYENYPELNYPNVYILDGGYRNFYSQYPSYCKGGYIRMYNKLNRHDGSLRQSVSKFRKSFDYSRKNLENQAHTLPSSFHPTFF